jgi:hypothetical protein
MLSLLPQVSEKLYVISRLHFHLRFLTWFMPYVPCFLISDACFINLRVWDLTVQQYRAKKGNSCFSMRLNFFLHHGDLTAHVAPHMRGIRKTFWDEMLTPYTSRLGRHGPLNSVLNFLLLCILKWRGLLKDAGIGGKIALKLIFELFRYIHFNIRYYLD